MQFRLNENCTPLSYVWTEMSIRRTKMKVGMSSSDKDPSFFLKKEWVAPGLQVRVHCTDTGGRRVGLLGVGTQLYKSSTYVRSRPTEQEIIKHITSQTV